MFMQRTASPLVICGGVAAAMIFLLTIAGLQSFDIVALFQSVSRFTQSAITRGYHLAPALMLGLALLAVVPMIAVISPIVFQFGQPNAATRRYRPTEDVTSDISGDMATHSTIAYLEVVGAAGRCFSIDRDMLRIGREDDNDIRIPSKDVHRYHAAIYRQDLDEWHIADLSGNSGAGVRVNGKPCRDLLLTDGDIIELGPGRLRFRTVHG